MNLMQRQVDCSSWTFSLPAPFYEHAPQQSGHLPGLEMSLEAPVPQVYISAPTVKHTVRHQITSINMPKPRQMTGIIWGFD